LFRIIGPRSSIWPSAGYDLEEAEFCYAPAFGSAKDPVNFAGMVAADVLKGDMPLSHWCELGIFRGAKNPARPKRGHCTWELNPVRTDF
jgi:hypothetical protein